MTATKTATAFKLPDRALSVGNSKNHGKTLVDISQENVKLFPLNIDGVTYE